MMGFTNRMRGKGRGGKTLREKPGGKRVKKGFFGVRKKQQKTATGDKANIVCQRHECPGGGLGGRREEAWKKRKT